MLSFQPMPAQVNLSELSSFESDNIQPFGDFIMSSSPSTQQQAFHSEAYSTEPFQFGPATTVHPETRTTTAFGSAQHYEASRYHLEVPYHSEVAYATEPVSLQQVHPEAKFPNQPLIDIAAVFGPDLGSMLAEADLLPMAETLIHGQNHQQHRQEQPKPFVTLPADSYFAVAPVSGTVSPQSSPSPEPQPKRKSTKSSCIKRKRTQVRAASPLRPEKGPDFLETLQSLLESGHPCLSKYGDEGFYIADSVALAKIWCTHRNIKPKRKSDGNVIYSLVGYYTRRGKLESFKVKLGHRSKNVYRIVDSAASAPASPSL